MDVFTNDKYYDIRNNIRGCMNESDFRKDMLKLMIDLCESMTRIADAVESKQESE